MLQAVFFDFNGVLVDDEGLHAKHFAETCREEGIEVSRDEYWRTYLHLDDRGAFAEALRRAGRPASDDIVARLCRKKEKAYAKGTAEGVPAVPGAPEFARACATRGPCAVVSGAIRAEVDMHLRRLGLEGVFPLYVTAEDTSRGKPDPEGYLLAVGRLSLVVGKRLEPSKCVALEDSPGGLRAARAAGLKTVGIATNYSEDVLRPECDLVVRDLTRLAVADLERLCG
ncbi:MAG TPA: HAD family phosphatase [Thermoplasmata archaeon]|nr:HAD family phosphatase [Thermoplasmata archaeon]